MKTVKSIKGHSLFGMLAVLVTVLCLVLPLEIFAAPPEGNGPPEGRGHPGTGDDDAGLPLGDLYGDQWMLIRDVGPEGDGAPILFHWIWPQEFYVEGDLVISDGDLPEDYTMTGGNCVQPFSFEPIYIAGEMFSYDLYIDSYGTEKTVYLIPLDEECKIPDAYADTWGEEVNEVDSGRLNLARSSQDVLDAAYEEALSTINKGTSITLDPAGRLVMLDLVEDEFVIAAEKTIDSPLENLALYQRLLLEGCLSATANVSLTEQTANALEDAGLANLVCVNETDPVSNEDLLNAAAFLGGSGDKSSRYNIDIIVYLNNMLGINHIVAEEKHGGSITVAGYYDFGDFTYFRDTSDLTVTADLLQPPDLMEDEEYPDRFYVENVAIKPLVFSANWDGTEDFFDYPIVNFTRAADDSLGIIYFIHNFALPEAPVAPLP